MGVTVVAIETLDPRGMGSLRIGDPWIILGLPM